MNRSLALAVAVSLGVSAHAQTWTEVGEAGHFPVAAPAAQIPLGSGPLAQIDGTRDSADDRDMYLIQIDNVGAFSASTVGGAVYDTQLFLFDVNGFGVTFDDDLIGSSQSRITGTFVPGPGLYYLAISTFDRDAASGGSEIWADTPYTTERAPDGPGAAGAIDGWVGVLGVPSTNPYQIRLTGCTFPNTQVHHARCPGSLLVYPVHRSGPGWFTILSVTNTNVQPANPNSFGGATNVHFDYVNVTANPANPFEPLACSIFDRIEFLTPADTLSVLTTCHNAWAPGGQEGYVVVTAEDPTQAPGYAWDHDYLVGSEFVLNATGIAYAVNAISFAALTANPAIAPDKLKLDGIAYSEAPEHLIIDSFIAATQSSLSLINLTGGVEAFNSLLFQVWNDNERPLSATRRFKCWFDQPLSVVSPLFTQAFLASIPNDPYELDITCDGRGDLETGWAIIDSIGVQRMSGDHVSRDGALLGVIAIATPGGINGGEDLWESADSQDNGALRAP